MPLQQKEPRENSRRIKSDAAQNSRQICRSSKLSFRQVGRNAQKPVQYEIKAESQFQAKLSAPYKYLVQWIMKFCSDSKFRY